MDPQNRFQIKSWTCPLAEEPSPVASSYQAAQVSLLSLAALKLQNDLLISLCRIAQLSPEPLCGPPRHVPTKHPTCRAFPRPSVMTHIHCLLPVVCMPRPPPSKGRHPRVGLEFFITVFLSFMWSRICPDQPLFSHLASSTCSSSPTGLEAGLEGGHAGPGGEWPCF